MWNETVEYDVKDAGLTVSFECRDNDDNIMGSSSDEIGSGSFQLDNLFIGGEQDFKMNLGSDDAGTVKFSSSYINF